MNAQDKSDHLPRGTEKLAVILAVAYRTQDRWQPDHGLVVDATLRVLESGEWRQFTGEDKQSYPPERAS